MNYTMTCLRTKSDYTTIFFTRSVQINVLSVDLHVLAKNVTSLGSESCPCAHQEEGLCKIHKNKTGLSVQ